MTPRMWQFVGGPCVYCKEPLKPSGDPGRPLMFEKDKGWSHWPCHQVNHRPAKKRMVETKQR